MAEMVRRSFYSSVGAGESWRKQILWVDDRPENNVHERNAFEAIGLRFILALSTEEAFERLPQQRFAAVISDMGRKEGPREGYVLLDRLRERGDNTLFFIYASSNSPEHKRETLEHGGQGCTNNPQELFEMITKCITAGRDTSTSAQDTGTIRKSKNRLGANTHSYQA